jgi:hypothetical protein
MHDSAVCPQGSPRSSAVSVHLDRLERMFDMVVRLGDRLGTLVDGLDRTRCPGRRPVSCGLRWIGLNGWPRPARRCWLAGSPGRRQPRSRPGRGQDRRRRPGPPGWDHGRRGPERAGHVDPATPARSGAGGAATTATCRPRRPPSSRARPPPTCAPNSGWWTWPRGPRCRSCGRKPPESGPRPTRTLPPPTPGCTGAGRCAGTPTPTGHGRWSPRAGHRPVRSSTPR